MEGILACGMTVVIVSAGIDLAVGSVLALSAVSFALLAMHHGFSAPAALAVVLLLGAGAGAASGALVAFARLQPFIVTLAAMVFARGLAKQLSGGQKISSYFQGADGRFVTVRSTAEEDGSPYRPAISRSSASPSSAVARSPTTT